MSLRDDILRDGVVTIPNLLTPEEVASINSVITGHFETRGNVYRYGIVQPNAAVEVPQLEWVFRHPKILEVYREILGSSEIMFTGHADIHQNMGFGWHKDDGRAIGGYFKKPYFVRDCEVYKIGFYMNDHSANKTGFHVKKGSHRFDNIEQGEPAYIPTRVGDAVIFDVRLTHRGKRYDYVEKALLVLGMLFGDKNGSSRKGKTVRELYQKLFGGEPKRSIFFTFGAANSYTEEFTRNNMRRQLNQVPGSTARMPDGLANGLKAEGVLLPDLLV